MGCYYLGIVNFKYDKNMTKKYRLRTIEGEVLETVRTD